MRLASGLNFLFNLHVISQINNHLRIAFVFPRFLKIHFFLVDDLNLPYLYYKDV
jgi:hypothetical protein